MFGLIDYWSDPCILLPKLCLLDGIQTPTSSLLMQAAIFVQLVLWAWNLPLWKQTPMHTEIKNFFLRFFDSVRVGRKLIHWRLRSIFSSSIKYKTQEFYKFGFLNQNGMAAAALEVLGRKILCKIFGPACVDDEFCIRTNKRLYHLLNDGDVVQYMNIQRLCWLAHVVRIEKDILARRVFNANEVWSYAHW